jgi:DNA-binding transcriptional ArsR family regulator
MGLNPERAELIARRFSALSEPVRVRLLDATHAAGEASVGELAQALGAIVDVPTTVQEAR